MIQVVDNVLKDPTVSEAVLLNRAKVIGRLWLLNPDILCHYTTRHYFLLAPFSSRLCPMNQTKSVVRSKGAARISPVHKQFVSISPLPFRMVAEAAAGKSKLQQIQAEAKVAAKLKREEMLRCKKDTDSIPSAEPLAER